MYSGIFPIREGGEEGIINFIQEYPWCCNNINSSLKSNECDCSHIINYYDIEQYCPSYPQSPPPPPIPRKIGKGVGSKNLTQEYPWCCSNVNSSLKIKANEVIAAVYLIT